MKWIVATNLRDDSRGAFEFASWLHAHARQSEAHPIASLAVVRDGGDFLNVPSGRSLMRERVEEATRQFLQQTPARDAIAEVKVELGTDVATTLCDVAHRMHGTLVLGRAAPRENTRLVRLGTVARRTLRKLGGPVVIVPPDWTATIAGEGPIMVAVDASPSSLSAIAFAEALATAVGRPMLAVQAIQGMTGLGSAFLAPAELTSKRNEHRQQEIDQLTAYLAEHGHASLAVRSEPGPTLHTLLDVADDVKAAAIVCGSRRLTLAERIFSASVGSELASFAEIPVAVVPPDFSGTGA